LPPLSRGILNQNQFNLTSFDSSNGFPNQIQMKINIFNSSFSITLGQVEGLIHNSSIYTQVNFRSNPNINGQNLVRKKRWNYIRFYEMIILEIQILCQ
jgi:hypothetical protein